MGSGGSFDFSQMKRFQKQLEELQRDQDKFCRECADYLAQRLLAKVKKRTPVGRAPKLASKTVKVKGASGKSRTFLSAQASYWAGYTGGTLRRGWTTSIHRKGNDYVIEINNPAQYASYVEYGHRQTPGRFVPAIGKTLKKAWVPGQFMMTISMRELEEQAPAMIEKKLTEMIRRALDAE